eukprot:scaffold1240_cov138-Amphora_coffeaeformis.AAC.2
MGKMKGKKNTMNTNLTGNDENSMASQSFATNPERINMTQQRMQMKHWRPSDIVHAPQMKHGSPSDMIHAQENSVLAEFVNHRIVNLQASQGLKSLVTSGPRGTSKQRKHWAPGGTAGVKDTNHVLSDSLEHVRVTVDLNHKYWSPANIVGGQLLEHEEEVPDDLKRNHWSPADVTGGIDTNSNLYDLLEQEKVVVNFKSSPNLELVIEDTTTKSEKKKKGKKKKHWSPSDIKMDASTTVATSAGAKPNKKHWSAADITGTAFFVTDSTVADSKEPEVIGNSKVDYSNELENSAGSNVGDSKGPKTATVAYGTSKGGKSKKFKGRMGMKSKASMGKHSQKSDKTTKGGNGKDKSSENPAKTTKKKNGKGDNIGIETCVPLPPTDAPTKAKMMKKKKRINAPTKASSKGSNGGKMMLMMMMKSSSPTGMRSLGQLHETLSNPSSQSSWESFTQELHEIDVPIEVSSEVEYDNEILPFNGIQNLRRRLPGQKERKPKQSPSNKSKPRPSGPKNRTGGKMTMIKRKKKKNGSSSGKSGKGSSKSGKKGKGSSKSGKIGKGSKGAPTPVPVRSSGCR